MTIQPTDCFAELTLIYRLNRNGDKLIEKDRVFNEHILHMKTWFTNMNIPLLVEQPLFKQILRMTFDVGFESALVYGRGDNNATRQNSVEQTNNSSVQE